MNIKVFKSELLKKINPILIKMISMQTKNETNKPKKKKRKEEL